MSIDIKKFAEWIVLYFNQNGIPPSPLKLQKILYYCESWCMAFECGPLFEVTPEAWANGPVYREVYDMYKDKYLRSQPISIAIDNLDQKVRSHFTSLNLSKSQSEVIQEVLRKYGSYSDEKLVLLTHTEAPWNLARKNCEPFAVCKVPISHESMKVYYKSILVKYGDKENCAA